MKSPTFIDVFSGCGGLSLGLFNAGWQGIFAIEKNPDAFSTLKHNLLLSNNKHRFAWPGWLTQSAMTVSHLLDNHRDELTSLRGQVDLIAGGPPCQGFSSAGKRNPDDPRNKLAEQYIEVVGLVRPRFLLVENVRGFNSTFLARAGGQKGKPYSEVVQEKLQQLGYETFSGVVCSSIFGVPQYRKRFIIIAIKRNNIAHELLNGANPINMLMDKAYGFRAARGLLNGVSVSVKEALSDLEVGSHEMVPHTGSVPGFRQVAYKEPGKLSNYQQLMRKGMDGVAPNSLRLARHTKPVVERFMEIQAVAALGKCLTPADREALGIKKHSITPLHPHLPSATVTTLPDDILHYSEPRILTVRENARLQSFPDWFEFKGKYTTGGKQRKLDCPRYTQVGNAVPPLLAEAIGEFLKDLVELSRLKGQGRAEVHTAELEALAVQVSSQGIPQVSVTAFPGPCL